MDNDNLTKVFGGLIDGLRLLQSDDVLWKPPADIYQGKRGWLIKLELAGVQQEDINIFQSGKIIRIQGRRRDLIASENVKIHELEIVYNTFERVIELPELLEDPDIETEFNQGMLLIQVNHKK